MADEEVKISNQSKEVLDQKLREEILLKFLQLRREAEELEAKAAEARREAKVLQNAYPFLGNCLGIVRKKDSEKGSEQEVPLEEDILETPKASKKVHPIQRKPTPDEIAQKKKKQKTPTEKFKQELLQLKASSSKDPVNPNLPSSYGQ